MWSVQLFATTYYEPALGNGLVARFFGHCVQAFVVVNGGGTAFFNAIKNACHKLNTAREGEPAARVLIVLSDRDDNESNTTLAQAIDDTAKTTRPQRIACRVTFGAASHCPRHPGRARPPTFIPR